MSNVKSNMSDKQRSFGSGIIITTMVISLSAVLTWGLLNSANVPVNEAKNEQQFKNLNSNIVSLNATGKVTNNKLDSLTFQLGEFAKALVVTQVELKQVKKDCDYNTDVIRKNKHNHDNDYKYNYSYEK